MIVKGMFPGSLRPEIRQGGPTADRPRDPRDRCRPSTHSGIPPLAREMRPGWGPTIIGPEKCRDDDP